MPRTYAWGLAPGQSGLFSSASSWLDVTDGVAVPATQPPGADDTISLGDGALVTGSGTVDSLDFSGLTTLDGTIDATAVYGLEFASGCTVDIAAGGLLQAPIFFLGGTNGTGILIDVAAGATLQSVGLTAASEDLSIKIAALTGSQAAIDVSGVGASLDSGGWSVWVGEAGSGTLTIAAGAQAGDGTLDSVDQDFFYSTNIGVKAGGDGTLSVTGPGSTYTVSDKLAVGEQGHGVLVLSDHATLIDTATQLNDYSNIFVGAEFGSTGTVIVESGAVLDSGAADLVVGSVGIGTLVVQGGTVLASNSGYTDIEAALVLGWNFSSDTAENGTGSVAVTGAASLIRADGPIWIGESGSGTMSITSAGTVSMDATVLGTKAGVVVGDQVGSNGTLLVVGAGSVLNVGIGRLSVGNEGTGTMSVAQGGAVFAGAAAYTGLAPAVRLGFDATGSGSVAIDGAGSTLGASGAVWIGDGGSGSLTISNGAAVSAGGTNDGGLGLIVDHGAGNGVLSIVAAILTVSDAAEIGARGDVTVGHDGVLAIGGDLTMVSGASLSLGDGVLSLGDVGPGFDVGTASIAAGTTLEGAGTFLAPSLVNNGVISVEAGTMVLQALVTGGGVIDVATNATLDLTDGVEAGQTVALAAQARLHLIDPANFDGTLDVGAGAATLDVDGLVANSASIVGGNTLAFDVAVLGQTQAESIVLGGLTGAIVPVQDGSEIVLPCFLAGTPILTARGEVAVEDLRVGDHVATFGGHGNPLKPIVWLGRSRFDADRHPDPERIVPIRIEAGALGSGVPHTDLLVSPGHRMLIDGGLIQAERLVNGATIRRDTTITQGEYFHVELAGHDVLLSAGVPSESYLDTGNRSAFANALGLADLHPDFSPRHWTETCLPQHEDGPALRAARARLLQAALAAGYRLIDDPDLHVVADGARFAPIDVAAKIHRFRLPAGCRDVRLMSRIWVPAEIDPASDDTRTLGVSVAGVILDGRPAVLPAAGDGWHWTEVCDGARWCWTGGAARLPSGVVDIAIELHGAATYWSPPLAHSGRVADRAVVGASH